MTENNSPRRKTTKIYSLEFQLFLYFLCYFKLWPYYRSRNNSREIISWKRLIRKRRRKMILLQRFICPERKPSCIIPFLLRNTTRALHWEVSLLSYFSFQSYNPAIAYWINLISEIWRKIRIGAKFSVRYGYTASFFSGGKFNNY